MIEHFKIYTDLDDDKTYAYCTYNLIRNHGLHKECIRIDLLFTDVESGSQDFKAGMPVYEIRFIQSIESKRNDTQRVEPAVFNYVSRGYDQHTILDLIGDCPEHREFLAQVGIHD